MEKRSFETDMVSPLDDMNVLDLELVGDGVTMVRPRDVGDNSSSTPAFPALQHTYNNLEGYGYIHKGLIILGSLKPSDHSRVRVRIILQSTQAIVRRILKSTYRKRHTTRQVLVWCSIMIDLTCVSDLMRATD